MRTSDRESTNQLRMPCELTCNYGFAAWIESQSLFRITRETVVNDHVGADYEGS